MSEAAVVSVPTAEEQELLCTCTNCKKQFSVSEVTVGRWREDGTLGQCVCRTCGKAASQLRRAGAQLTLLTGDARQDFFRRVQESQAPDVKKLFDEMVTSTETRSCSQDDNLEGDYKLVSDLEKASPYKSRPEALRTLCANSYTLVGMDGLERVWVPTYSRRENNHTGNKGVRETQLTSRQAVGKAKAKPKPKPAAKALAASSAAVDPLKEYPKATQAAVKKALTHLEKGAKDLQECIFVLSDPQAQGFTSQIAVRNGNSMITSCLEYLGKIKQSVADKVAGEALTKLTKDCEETLKQTKQAYKKLSGDMADIPGDLKETLAGQEGGLRPRRARDYRGAAGQRGTRPRGSRREDRGERRPGALPAEEAPHRQELTTFCCGYDGQACCSHLSASLRTYFSKKFTLQ